MSKRLSLPRAATAADEIEFLDQVIEIVRAVDQADVPRRHPVALDANIGGDRRGPDDEPVLLPGRPHPLHELWVNRDLVVKLLDGRLAGAGEHLLALWQCDRPRKWPGISTAFIRLCREVQGMIRGDSSASGPTRDMKALGGEMRELRKDVRELRDQTRDAPAQKFSRIEPSP